MTAAATSPSKVAWVGRLLRLRPARVPVGHTIRSAVSVGGPFIWGALADEVQTGMWIALGCLLMSPGEREGSHRLNVTIVLVATPIGAAGYLVGFAQGWSLLALIPLMAALAFVCGAIPAYGPALSVAGMQFLLVAALALGVPEADWWVPIGWFVLGGGIYFLLMLGEFAVDRNRPERVVVGDVVRAVAELARAREEDPGQAAGGAVAHRRAQAIAAIEAARVVLTTGRGRSDRRSAHWAALAQVLDSADSVVALLIGTTDRADLQAARERLEAGISPTVPPAVPPAPTRAAGVLGVRIGDLERGVAALRTGRRGVEGTAGDPGPVLSARAIANADRSWRERLIVGPDALAAAGRLALAYAVAVGARAYFPFPHWYWIPLTVCLVMKPDFGSVFTRAILRVIGTVAGVPIATAVILLTDVPALHDQRALVLGIAIALLAATVPWFMMRSYALQAVSIAPIVILLVSVIQPEGDPTNYSIERVGATVVGGLIVLVFGYALWPGARRTDVTGRLRRAVDALASYLRTAASPVVGEPSKDTDRHLALVQARRTTYSALADLRTQLERTLGEAPPASVVAASWLPAITSVERLTDAVSAYAADRLRGQRPSGEPAADAVLHGLVELRADDAERVRLAAEQLRKRLTATGNGPW